MKPCDRIEWTCAYMLGALPASEATAVKAHLASCERCRRAVATLRPFAESPDVLTPSSSVQQQLAGRIAAETGRAPVPPPAARWSEPNWEEVSPGLWCKLMSSDEQTGMLSMMVRLAPGVEYPPHTHAGVEELHLLDGELWIDDNKLFPGDYNRAEVGTSDRRVWSETGCTCVLITSSKDVLG